MGSLINSITGVAGLKLFPGGPYADNGMGDKALATTGQIAGYGKQIADANLGAATAPLGTTPGSLPGYSQYLPALIAQFAELNGLSDPTGGTSGTTGSNFNGTAAAPSVGDPYKLDPYQQRQLNATQDTTNAQMQTAIDQAKALLAQRGINDPRSIAAAEQHIRDTYAGKLGEQQTAAGQTAKQSKVVGTASLMDMLTNLYNTQAGAKQTATGNVQAGAGMMNPLAATQSGIGQQKIAEKQASASNLGSLLGYLYGAGVFGGKPVTGAAAAAGAQPAGDTVDNWMSYWG